MFESVLLTRREVGASSNPILSVERKADLCNGDFATLPAMKNLSSREWILSTSMRVPVRGAWKSASWAVLGLVKKGGALEEVGQTDRARQSWAEQSRGSLRILRVRPLEIYLHCSYTPW
jgi:hypothetical protein